MPRKESVLHVTDNCGAKLVKCIGLYRGSPSNKVRLSEFIKISVQHRDPHKQFLKYSDRIFLALLVARRRATKRLSGHFIRFARNSVIIISDENKLFATRLKGPLCSELRRIDSAQILFLAKKII